MKVIIILTLLFSGIMSQSIHQQMMDLIKDMPAKDQFKIWHYATNQKYDINTEVGLTKYRIFKKNLKFIRETNLKGLSYTLTLTKFADISQEEFEENYLMKNQGNPVSEEELALLQPGLKKEILFDEMADMDDLEGSLSSSSSNDDDDNEEDNFEFKKYDYRPHYNYTKDQGKCGSCWAFATTFMLEYFVNKIDKKANKTILSPQELIDCSENSGCEGGHFLRTLLWVQLKGIVEEAVYPYQAVENKCDYKNKPVYAVIKGVFYCSREHSTRHINRDCSMRDIISYIKRGPYATSIDGKNGFQFLGSGIWNQDCASLNHAVSVVYVNTEEKSVTIVNSWGPTFGVNGQGRISYSNPRGHKGCGALESAFQPEKIFIVAKS